jgi:hypothetical protein
LVCHFLISLAIAAAARSQHPTTIAIVILFSHLLQAGFAGDFLIFVRAAPPAVNKIVLGSVRNILPRLLVLAPLFASGAQAKLSGHDGAAQVAAGLGIMLMYYHF